MATVLPKLSLLVLLSLSVVAPCTAAITVVRVLDGDTLDVLLDDQPARLRLIGINSPELHEIAPCGRRWAQAAKSALTEMAKSGELRIAYDVVPKDQYGRHLVYLYAGNTFINEMLLWQGFGLVGNMGKNRQHRQTFTAAQSYAKRVRAGMWGG